MAQTTIAVYQGEKHFAAVEVKTNGSSAELLRYTLRPLPESGFSGEWLGKVWKKEGYGRSKVKVLLPQGLVKYKSLTLPNLPAEQLRSAVRLEMENSEPGSIYRILSVQPGAQQSSLRLALIKDAELESYLEPFREAGLTVDWSGLNHHGLQNFLGFNLDFFEGPGVDLYLSLYPTGSEFGALNDTELLYRRSLLIGTEQLGKDPENYLSELIEAVRLSLASYQASFNNPLPEQIWVFGESKPEKEWLEKLSEALGIKFVVAEKTRLSGMLTGSNTPALAPLIGLALDEAWLSRKDWRFNTRSQERQEKKRQKTLLAVQSGLVGALLIAGLLLGVQARVIRSQKDALWLDEQRETLARLRMVQNDINQKTGHLKTLENWLSRRGQELEFLRTLQAVLPEETRITDLIMEDVVIKGLSGSTPSVSRLLERLQRTPELRSFKLKGSITSDKNGMELFQMEGKFDPGEQKP